jgi:hypothetical protein
MIAQVVVRIGDQNVEYDPPPQSFHVSFRFCTVLTQRVDDFKIASGFVVSCARHTHCGQKGNASLAIPVEAAEQQHGLFDDDFDPPNGNGYTRFFASARATASQATVLISSSRRGNFAMTR